MYDVIIIGGGPAGLSAGLILGRCRRRVLVCDAGHPRNACARAIHGFLTRDGAPPLEFLELARQELRQYETVEFRKTLVTDARREALFFEIATETGERLRARKLLLATGVVDELPEIEGIHELYGGSVYHCPYCDAWEVRDQPLAIFGQEAKACRFAVELTLWSQDVALCTGGAEPAEKERAMLEKQGIVVYTQVIARLEGRDGMLERIVFENGESLPRRALFFSAGQYKRQKLSDALGCDYTSGGCVRVDDYGAANIPGLYCAGDLTKLSQMVMIAASEGLQAGIVINKALMEEDLKRE